MRFGLLPNTEIDAALARELQEVIREAKRMASQIQESSDLWDLEHYLTERHKQIDRKYDYRYSQLTLVLGRLLHENRISEEDLRGLREDKMKSLRSFAKFRGGAQPGLPAARNRLLTATINESHFFGLSTERT